MLCERSASSRLFGSSQMSETGQAQARLKQTQHRGLAAIDSATPTPPPSTRYSRSQSQLSDNSINHSACLPVSIYKARSFIDAAINRVRFSNLLPLRSACHHAHVVAGRLASWLMALDDCLGENTRADIVLALVLVFPVIFGTIDHVGLSASSRRCLIAFAMNKSNSTT